MRETNIPPHEFTGKVMRMTRYQKLDSEIIPLSDGQNPPAHKINPDCKEQPSNPRKCIECGKIHDLFLENTMTGERIEEIDKCKECLFAGMWVGKNGID